MEADANAGGVGFSKTGSIWSKTKVKLQYIGNKGDKKTNINRGENTELREKKLNSKNTNIKWTMVKWWNIKQSLIL